MNYHSECKTVVNFLTLSLLLHLLVNIYHEFSCHSPFFICLVCHICTSMNSCITFLFNVLKSNTIFIVILKFGFYITSGIPFKLASVSFWHVSISFWALPYSVTVCSRFTLFFPWSHPGFSHCPKNLNSFYLKKPGC